jgi:cytochrome c oxidase cbb3-type subunit 1
MLNELTKIERYLALGLAILVVLAGLLLAAAGRDTLMGSHGWVVLLFGLAVSLSALSGL